MVHKEKTNQPGKPTVEEVQAEQIKTLSELLIEVRDSHRRMVLNETLHKEKIDYGPETLKSIEIQEALNQI